jgi:hypothetical protein
MHARDPPSRVPAVPVRDQQQPLRQQFSFATPEVEGATDEAVFTTEDPV